MYVSKLSLTNFRNYHQATLTFSPHTNVIYGDNAQGKTNVLEAVYLASHAKSFKNAPPRDMICTGEDYARVEIAFISQKREENLCFTMDRNNHRKIVLNDVIIKKPARLLEHFKVVFFSPDDLQLIKKGPELRRKFIDQLLSQLSPAYLAQLMAYQRLLLQKNQLLRGIKEQKMEEDTLPIWNEKQAQLLWPLMQKRKEILENLQEKCEKMHRDISGQTMKLTYRPSVTETDSIENIAAFLTEKKPVELRAGQAIYGAHRDDFLVEIEGRPARQFASQGQQRTAALCLKLAQSECIKEVFSEYPLILLDDMMSELDKKRRQFLLSNIEGKQVIITCTDKETYLKSDGRYFCVKDGSIKQEK